MDWSTEMTMSRVDLKLVTYRRIMALKKFFIDCKCRNCEDEERDALMRSLRCEKCPLGYCLVYPKAERFECYECKAVHPMTRRQVFKMEDSIERLFLRVSAMRSRISPGLGVVSPSWSKPSYKPEQVLFMILGDYDESEKEQFVDFYGSLFDATKRLYDRYSLVLYTMNMPLASLLHCMYNIGLVDEKRQELVSRHVGTMMLAYGRFLPLYSVELHVGLHTVANCCLRFGRGNLHRIGLDEKVFAGIETIYDYFAEKADLFCFMRSKAYRYSIAMMSFGEEWLIEKKRFGF